MHRSHGRLLDRLGGRRRFGPRRLFPLVQDRLRDRCAVDVTLRVVGRERAGFGFRHLGIVGAGSRGCSSREDEHAHDGPYGYCLRGTCDYASGRHGHSLHPSPHHSLCCCNRRGESVSCLTEWLTRPGFGNARPHQICSETATKSSVSSASALVCDPPLALLHGENA